MEGLENPGSGRNGNPPTDEGKTLLTRLLPWLVLLLAALALLYFLDKGCRGSRLNGGGPAIDAMAEPGEPIRIPTSDGKSEIGTMRDFELPSGVSIKLEEGTLPMKVAEMLSSGNINPNTPFVFDRIDFDDGTAKLKDWSTVQLNQLAILLTVFPRKQVRIEGHTDNSGTADANMTLSLARAKAVTDYLVGRGISANQIESVGRGQLKPLVPNDTEENRAKNIRVELYLLD